MPQKHIVFSSERLPKMLLEAADLLIKLSQINKEMEAMKQPYCSLIEKKKRVELKVENWIAENIVEVE